MILEFNDNDIVHPMGKGISNNVKPTYWNQSSISIYEFIWYYKKYLFV